jgi:hypothetical protein
MRHVIRFGIMLVMPFFWHGEHAWADVAQAQETTPAQPDAATSAEETAEEGASTAMATGLIFDEDVAGEIVVRDDEGLAARFFKTEGHRITLGLPTGRYEITCETPPEKTRVDVRLAADEQRILSRADLCGSVPERGDEEDAPARHRSRCRSARPESELRSWHITADSGFWLADGSSSWSAVVTDHGIHSNDGGFSGGMSIGYRISPEWMVGFSLSNNLIEASDWENELGEELEHASMVTALSLNARYYLPPLAKRAALKPYVSAGLGPYMGLDVESRHTRHEHDSEHVRAETVLGGHIGGGVDIHPTNWLVLGTNLEYHITPDFSNAVAGRRNGTGAVFGFQMGVTFGKRLPPSGH